MEEPMDHSSLPPSAKRTPQKTCTDFSTRDEMGDSLSSASTEIARGHPKRKPDKSTICRVRSSKSKLKYLFILEIKICEHSICKV